MKQCSVQNAQEFGKVAVLLGGHSAEREVSLQSGAAVLAALQQRGVDAQPLDPVQGDVLVRLQQKGFSRAFIALHGRGGEDGVIQGALETIGMPYTGSGVLGSALSMDKIRTKQIWQSALLPTPAFAVARTADELSRAGARVGYPMMVKPAHEGSSIGMSKVDSDAGLSAAWDLASELDGDLLAEHWVEGPEFTAAILGDEVLPLIRLETPNLFYDYDAKYRADTTRYLCPCGLPDAVETGLKQLALRAFRAVGASGWGRVDFLLDGKEQAQLIEVNTVPGMTDHSLVPMAAKAAGVEFDELVWRILETSMSAREAS